MELKDGVPCEHPGCANHVTHPCEGCGRIGASSKLTAVRIAELEAQLTAAQERERWIPVTERLPKMGKEVLACFDGQVTSSGIVFGSIWQGLRHTLPTHWRELPAPPQEAADAE